MSNYTAKDLKDMLAYWQEGSPHTYRISKGQLEYRWNHVPVTTPFQACDESVCQLAYTGVLTRRWCATTVNLMRSRVGGHQALQAWIVSKGTIRALEIAEPILKENIYEGRSLSQLETLVWDSIVAKGAN